MITFARPEVLWLLALLPLWFFVSGRGGKVASVRFSSTELARTAARQSKRRWWRFHPLLRTISAVLLVLALARPQTTHAATRVEASGIDIMLALDVSRSMDAEDMGSRKEPQTRLQAAKEVVTRFIESRPNDRIGLIAFAGAPYLVSPLTLDHDWLVRNLERLDTGMVEDGTAIGSALATSVDRLTGERGSENTSRIVVLLTDGVNNAGAIQPSLAAESAKALGVKAYAVGVGADDEALIAVQDPEGHERAVRARVAVDEDTLRKIADTTGAAFFHATDAVSLAKVYAEIDRMEATPRTVDRVETVNERYAMFITPALAVLGCELLLGLFLRRRIP